MADVEVTEEFRAQPRTVYELISNVTRMGSWSPETTSCRWLDGSTAFDVDFAGVPIAQWAYDLEPASTGCTVPVEPMTACPLPTG